MDLQTESQWITQTCYSNIYNTECLSQKQSNVMPKTIRVLLAVKEKQTLYSFILLLLKKVRHRGFPAARGTTVITWLRLLQLKPGWGYFSARHSVVLPRPLKCVRKTGHCCRETDGYMCFDTHSKPSQSATDWQLLNSAESSTVSGHRKIFAEKLNTTERTHSRQFPLHFLFLQVATTGKQLVNWEPLLKRTKPVSRKNRPTDKASCSCAQLAF